MRVKRRFGSPLAKKGLPALILTGVMLAGSVTLPATEARAQSADEGRAIFQKICVACHTIGGGRLIGADLQGVTKRQERDWLIRWISAPDKMLAEGDPIATRLLKEYNNVPMPNLGMTETQVASLIAYLETQSGEAADAQPVQTSPSQAVALPPGDSIIGKDLFTGVARFENGGPACRACHSITGIGALGGGALGPDLTPTFSKFGEAGTASMLATMPFPTMNAIFTKRPLTTIEQVNVRAFLQAASLAERPPQAVGRLALLAVAGAAFLFAIGHLIWRRRLAGVRKPMVTRSEAGKS